MSSGSTSTPARSRITGSQPCSAAASTRSSPSATNRPSRRLARSFRMVFSCWLSLEVITKKAPHSGRPVVEVDAVAEASGSRRLPGGVRKTSEGLGVADGDVGQHLAVELDLGQAQAVHELAVAHSLLARGGVDALDPQAAEVALAVLAVAVGVGARLEQLLLRPLVARVLLAAVALGPLERGAALLARVYGTLDAAHLPSSFLTRFASSGWRISGSSM